VDRVHRFIRLANDIGWSFADLDWAVTATGAAAQAQPLSAAIPDIARIKNLAALLDVPIDVVCSFIFDMKTIGVGYGPHSEALFDTIFNNPQLSASQTPYHPQNESSAYPLNSLYKDAPSSWTIGSDNDPMANRIAGGLQVSLDDLNALGNYFFYSSVMLTVPNLSILYRHARLAQLVSLPIPQYLKLLSLLFPRSAVTLSLDNIASIIGKAQWLQDSGINVYQLDYIINSATSPYAATGYQPDR
ncbi:MAG: hypothetical protein GY805_01255, partial [Chloroflexi bacterium]|nr:hypothetical protein [Chloroflexota bacterium]